ncbi:MAG: tetratricopeptide repeat protein [Caulobacteraceae bacterium]|nr:tetratricopeptide repeat protein [Caulobacter sp.]
MTRAQAEFALAAAGAQDDARFPLFEAALACALHETPDRDPQHAHGLCAEAVERLSERLQALPPEDAVCEALGADLGLGGDLFTYDDLKNADLLSVCRRRRGLPVALGVLMLEVCRRCGLEVAGVDFPAHFLVRIETADGPMALDPFTGGQVVMPSDLTRRALRAGLTPGVVDDLDRLMTAIPDRQVVKRLQNNIFARAIRSGDFAQAERSALRRALLDPADHRPWIDVAAAREAQGRLAGALEALSKAQALDGGAALAARVARERVRLRLN